VNPLGRLAASWRTRRAIRRFARATAPLFARLRADVDRDAAAATVDVPSPSDRVVVWGNYRRAPFAERPRRRTVTVCAWCPDADHQTADARANGFDVSHTICATCADRWRE